MIRVTCIRVEIYEGIKPALLFEDMVKYIQHHGDETLWIYSGT